MLSQKRKDKLRGFKVLLLVLLTGLLAFLLIQENKPKGCEGICDPRTNFICPDVSKANDFEDCGKKRYYVQDDNNGTIELLIYGEKRCPGSTIEYKKVDSWFNQTVYVEYKGTKNCMPDEMETITRVIKFVDSAKKIRVLDNEGEVFLRGEGFIFE